jgi:peptidyl-prolyl cis-trans isomerase D
MEKAPKKRIVTKKYLARVEKERRQTRLIMGAAILVVGLVVLLIGYGFLESLVLRPNQPVARVGNETITTREFQTRARYARQNIVQRYNEMLSLSQMFGDDPATVQYIQSNLQQLSFQLQPFLLGQQVLDSLIEDRLIRQEAARLGITVSSEEVEKAIQVAFGFQGDDPPTPTEPAPTVAPATLSPTQMALVSPTPTSAPTEAPTASPTPEAGQEPTAVVPSEAEEEPTPTPTLFPTIAPTPFTLEAYQIRYQEYVSGLKTNINMSEADFRYLFESQLYVEKVMDAVLGEVPREQEHYWLRHIQVEDVQLAEFILTLLQDGEDFTAMAAEYSVDFSADSGGDLGWLTENMLEPEMFTAIADLNIGDLSQPVQSLQGWHVFQLLGKDLRPVSDSEYEQLRLAEFQIWLDNQRETVGVTLYDYWIDRVPTQPTINTGAF